MRPGKGEKIDCPNVFRFGDSWYMIYVGIKGNVGYETYLAESDDLLSWRPLGKVLPFPESGWDRWQAAGRQRVLDRYTWDRTALGYLSAIQSLTDPAAPVPIPPDLS